MVIVEGQQHQSSNETLWFLCKTNNQMEKHNEVQRSTRLTNCIFAKKNNKQKLEMLLFFSFGWPCKQLFLIVRFSIEKELLQCLLGFFVISMDVRKNKRNEKIEWKDQNCKQLITLLDTLPIKVLQGWPKLTQSKLTFFATQDKNRGKCIKHKHVFEWNISVNTKIICLILIFTNIFHQNESKRNKNNKKQEKKNQKNLSQTKKALNQEKFVLFCKSEVFQKRSWFLTHFSCLLKTNKITHTKTANSQKSKSNTHTFNKKIDQYFPPQEQTPSHQHDESQHFQKQEQVSPNVDKWLMWLTLHKQPKFSSNHPILNEMFETVEVLLESLQHKMCVVDPSQSLPQLLVSCEVPKIVVCFEFLQLCREVQQLCQHLPKQQMLLFVLPNQVELFFAILETQTQPQQYWCVRDMVQEVLSMWFHLESHFDFSFDQQFQEQDQTHQHAHKHQWLLCKLELTKLVVFQHDWVTKSLFCEVLQWKRGQQWQEHDFVCFISQWTNVEHFFCIICSSTHCKCRNNTTAKYLTVKCVASSSIVDWHHSLHTSNTLSTWPFWPQKVTNCV